MHQCDRSHYRHQGTRIESHDRNPQQQLRQSIDRIGYTHQHRVHFPAPNCTQSPDADPQHGGNHRAAPGHHQADAQAQGDPHE